MDILSLTEYASAMLIVSGTVFADIWFFVDLFKIRNGAQLFLDDSKKENFEKTKKILKRAKNVLAVTVIIDMLCLFHLLNNLRFGFVDSLSVVQLTILVFHLIIGIPILKMGNQAESRYIHLYPPVPKMQMPVNEEKFKTTETDWDKWFNNSKEYKSTIPDKINEDLDIMGDPDSELIKYVEGGYSEGVHTDLQTAKPDEGSELMSCPFCGSLNSINNEACDFCGAELKKE